MSLENAPDEVKLAVDLIVLLEENGRPDTVLKALEMVKRDYEKKWLKRLTSLIELCRMAAHAPYPAYNGLLCLMARKRHQTFGSLIRPPASDRRL